jgi:formylglycine-generating enzyme required for sulfatase activity
MFTLDNEAESQRFLAILADVLREPPAGVDPYVIVTIRADSVEALLQRWPALGLDTPKSLYLPPLSPSAYRDVVLKPAEVYSQRVRRLRIEPALVDALVKDATGADALPLLAFTLEKLFTEFGADGNLTLARYDAMGGIGGSIDRALAEAQRQAGAAGTEECLRRLVVPGLATWDQAAGAAKRLVAHEDELMRGDRASLAPLANALVANRLLTRGAGTLEVAHEALLRRAPIAGWLEEQKDALKLRDDILREAKEWAEGGKHAEGLVRRGERLKAALDLWGDPDFSTTLLPADEYLAASRTLEESGRRRARLVQAVIYTLFIGIIVGLVGWINQASLKEQARWYWVGRPYRVANVDPYVLTGAAERALKPRDTFKECARHCPEMVVIPAGRFMMGSPATEKGHDSNEAPQHEVNIARPFAISKHLVTFEQWDTCVAFGDCAVRPHVSDAGWGRGARPVIYVTLEDVRQYVKWLARMTGKPYRLLSEAEYEYAARAGGQTAYPWGGEVGKDNANCDGCGSQWGGKQTAPVGSFPANGFGLYDMVGNLWQWTADCYHDAYQITTPKGKIKAPTDGSPWRSADCKFHAVRGGSWYVGPDKVRSAIRSKSTTDGRDYNLGFRVARTLRVP